MIAATAFPLDPDEARAVGFDRVETCVPNTWTAHRDLSAFAKRLGYAGPLGFLFDTAVERFAAGNTASWR